MRLHRFYTNQKIEDETIHIDNSDLIHQWRNVFRYMVGAQVIVFNGDGYDYLCMIGELHNRTASLAVVSRKKSILPERKIGLVIALVKKDTMEWIIEKATELGVSEVFPITAERSEKKSLNMERATKIAIEASEQSGRGDIVEIFDPVDLSDFLASKEMKTYEERIIFHTGKSKTDRFAGDNQSTPILLAIGPEGGWSDRDITLFSQQGFVLRSLGDVTLRAETAVIVALARLEV